jgi:hypothetical protein
VPFGAAFAGPEATSSRIGLVEEVRRPSTEGSHFAKKLAAKHKQPEKKNTRTEDNPGRSVPIQDGKSAKLPWGNQSKGTKLGDGPVRELVANDRDRQKADMIVL